MANLIMTQDGEVSVKDLLDQYFGSGGAAGGGTASGAGAGIGAIGAAIINTIIGQKTKDKHIPNTGAKPNQEAKPIPDGIPSDLATPGIQELPYLPNTGAKPYQEAKPIPDGIPSDLATPGIQELPYLPNTGTAEKEGILPTVPPISEGLPNTEPSIKDETETNIETGINPGFDMQSMYDFILQQQQRQWDREDQIRAETQAREDSAYQRAVEDARKAGINVNLMGINPAQSGGGITQATGLDYSPWTAEINKQLALIEQEIDNNFQGDENSKDRLTKGLTSLLQLFTLFALKG